MAGWRQAVALAMTGEEIEALTALSRSRTEPAGRVSRAAMLLGYREKPSRSLPWDEDLACIIRQCNVASSERWPMARLRHLTDRDRAKADDHAGGQGLVGIFGLRRAKEHGYPHELWTTRLLARHARRRGPAAGHQCLARLAQGTVCKLLGQEIKPHKVRYYLERRRVRAQDGGSSVCLPRGPGPEERTALGVIDLDFRILVVAEGETGPQSR